MPLSNKKIVGTIALETAGLTAGRPRLADDTCLASLLASLAHCSSLAVSEGPPLRLVASTRFSRFMPDDEATCETIRADVARLVDELEQEFELVAPR